MCDKAELDLRDAKSMGEALGMKPSTFRDVARRRKFPRFEIGHAVRWNLPEILRLVREERP